MALLISELYRMKVLETDFFVDDDQVTDRTRLKPDPAVRARLFQTTAEARKWAAAVLATSPSDPDATFAMSVAAGVETDYTVLVEKRYFRALSLSRESQGYARRLLALEPPMADGYVTVGMMEYVVGSMNWFFRLFIRFDQVEGSKPRAVENLKLAAGGARYFAPLARLMLSVIYLRERQPQQALEVLRSLARDFPENPLIASEIRKIDERALRPRKR
jgi:hypothetical protein